MRAIAEARMAQGHRQTTKVYSSRTGADATVDCIGSFDIDEDESAGLYHQCNHILTRDDHPDLRVPGVSAQTVCSGSHHETSFTLHAYRLLHQAGWIVLVILALSVSDFEVSNAEDPNLEQAEAS